MTMDSASVRVQALDDLVADARRAARLLRDLDGYTARLRTKDPSALRLEQLEQRLADLRRLLEAIPAPPVAGAAEAPAASRRS